MALEGHRVSSKKPSRVRGDRDEGVAGRNGREYCFPEKGVIDLPSRQIDDFSQKGNRKKIELEARPGIHFPFPFFLSQTSEQHSSFSVHSIPSYRHLLAKVNSRHKASTPKAQRYFISLGLFDTQFQLNLSTNIVLSTSIVKSYGVTNVSQSF